MKENAKKVRTPSTRNPPGPRLLAVFLPLMFVRAFVCSFARIVNLAGSIYRRCELCAFIGGLSAACELSARLSFCRSHVLCVCRELLLKASLCRTPPLPAPKCHLDG